MPRRTRSKANIRQTIFEGRVFRVERELVTLPDGRTATIEAVRHRGSVVLIPQPAPGQVVLIRQYRHVIGQWIWELPAGSLEPGETMIRGARRECEEETGWRPRRVVRLGEYFATPGFCDERMVFYACLDLVRPANPVAADPDEQIEPKVFTMRQAWNLVRRGDVKDMKTVLGLAMSANRVPTQA